MQHHLPRSGVRTAGRADRTDRSASADEALEVPRPYRSADTVVKRRAGPPTERDLWQATPGALPALGPPSRYWASAGVDGFIRAAGSGCPPESAGIPARLRIRLDTVRPGAAAPGCEREDGHMSMATDVVDAQIEAYRARDVERFLP